MNPKSTQKEKDVPTKFKEFIATMKVSRYEFHSKVDPAFRNSNSKRRGRPVVFAACVKALVAKVSEKLRGKPEYDPFFLMDEEMGIDKHEEAVSDICLAPKTRAMHREIFQREASLGVEKIHIHFFGKMYDGNNPDYVFIWKMPAVHGPHDDAKVASAIGRYREITPKMMSNEAVRHFNTILNNVTDVPAPARDVLSNYLFLGDPNPNKAIAEECAQFVVDVVMA